MPPLRLAFMGTPGFAATILDAVAQAGHDIACVYCQPPRQAGRGQKIVPSAVETRAAARGLAVRHPVRLGPEEAAEFGALGLDAAVVAAYGLILPRAILAAPRLGCFNVHASLLPRWRGAAPIERAILAGDAETGISIMRMDEGLDTGPVLLTETVPIGLDATAASLREDLARRGAQLMVRALGELQSLPQIPQAEAGITYAKKIARAESRIDWRRDAAEIERLVRALPAWFEAKGERIRFLEAALGAGTGAPGTVLDAAPTVACGTGALRLVRLQRAGRTPALGDAFLRGFPLPPGTVLPCPATG